MHPKPRVFGSPISAFTPERLAADRGSTVRAISWPPPRLAAPAGAQYAFSPYAIYSQLQMLT